MDPEAKRHIWEMMESISKTRTIILSTHSMEVRTPAQISGALIVTLYFFLLVCLGM